MTVIRSVLWIGPAERFESALEREAPTLDLVWERDVASALGLGGTAFDAVLLDADDAARALADLGTIAPRFPGAPRVVRIGRASARQRRQLEAAGAAAVIERPARASGRTAVEVDELEKLLRASGVRSTPRGDARNTPSGFERILGESPALTRVLDLAERAAATRASVLLSGETGTGKELVAGAIHRAGPRRSQPFVAANCAALPETLLESALLGHARGAFTGADRDHRGLFEEADGGTLFLDEIGETSPAFQAALLRVLQERTVRPVGASRERRVDVRVISATHRDLWREASEGRFREDLFYRLAVFPIHLPPLRERPADVLQLASRFLERFGREEGRPGCTLSPEAARLLQSHRWPGNVRELENEIQRAVALAEPGTALTPGHFSERLGRTLAPLDGALSGPFTGETLRESLGRVEAWLVRRALDANGGQRSETARRLGLTREGLYKKMKRLGIE
jgi:transcriptional regulator with GAF, ATPase, and Fis domain